MAPRTALLLPLLLAAVGGIVAAACTTSGTLGAQDAGILEVPDGSAIEFDGQAFVPNYACAFEEQSSYVCPDVTLAPSSWQAQCVDGDDCSSRVNGTATVAGCIQTTGYQDVQVLKTNCAAWAAAGGSLPVIDSGPAPACAPGNVSSFKPTWHPPRTPVKVCTRAQIVSYEECLDESATVYDPTACAEWTGTLSSVDQGCLNCLQSNESEDEYGPLVFLPTETLVNVAGCIALAEGKSDGTGCGGALSADQECDRAACLPTCPTQTSSQVETEGACESLADQGACQTYATPAGCAGAIELGDAGTPAEQSCFGFPTGTSTAIFEQVAAAFCSGG
jgi:hypothetical protein